MPRAQLATAVGDGPLLVLTTNGLATNNHEITMHVAELNGEGSARPFWRSRGNAEVLARLDRDHLLLASYGEPYALVVIDLPTGTSRVLANGCPHDFVTWRDDVVLHLGDPREAARDNYFYATPWRGDGKVRRLCEQRFASVPQVAGNLAVAIAEDEPAVWLVSLTNANGRAIWQPPAGASNVRVALSPGGQRLAIGCVQPGNGKGLLTVVDAGTAAIVRSWPDLPIHVSPLSSESPSLVVGWHSDAEVVCSETRGNRLGTDGGFVFVRRSLATGEITDETTYGPIGLSHQTPRPANAAVPVTAPAFVTDVHEGRVRLLRTGESTPLAVIPEKKVQWEDQRIAPDGQSAVARLGEQRTRCTLFTAAAKGGRLLLEGWAYDIQWLPGATTR